MTILADHLLIYDTRVNTLKRELREVQMGHFTEIDPDIMSMVALCSNTAYIKAKTQKLLLDSDIADILEYYQGEQYTILDTRLSQRELDSIVHYVSPRHRNLIYILKEWQKLVKDPDAYHEEIKQRNITRIKTNIRTETLKFEKAKETIRQIIELPLGKTVPEYDFSFIIENYDRVMIADHWKLVQELELVDFFRHHYNGRTDEDALTKLGEATDEKYGHSGSSFIYICNVMHAIALSWTEFIQSYYDHYRDILESIGPHLSELQIY